MTVELVAQDNNAGHAAGVLLANA